jgi:hypothetical protein
MQALVTTAFAERFASGLKNCKLNAIGSGIRYHRQANPKAIGSGVHEWLTEFSGCRRLVRTNQKHGQLSLIPFGSHKVVGRWR